MEDTRPAFASLVVGAALLVVSTAPLGCGGSSSTPPASPVCPESDAGDPTTDPSSFVKATPVSCEYSCPLACPETTTGYTCPSLAAWNCLPHADSCGTWDGTYPTVTPGQCTVTTPTGEAAKYAGNDTAHPGVFILPDGRRVTPAGAEWIFQESDLSGGLTTGITAVPGTNYVLTVDDGYGDHAVRAIDVTKIGTGNPVVSYVKFDEPAILNSGIAFAAPDLVLVATDDGNMQALTLDTTTGILTRDDTRSVKLPAPPFPIMGLPDDWYVSGVAVSPDGTRLVATSVAETALLVYDLTAGPTYGTLLGQVDLGTTDTFAASFDPNDPTGHFVYVTLWAGRAVLEVDVSAPKAPKVARTFATEKDPEGLAFLDARWLVVANDLGESLSLVDRTSGTVTNLPIDASGTTHGYDLSTLAYDAPNKRLYASLAGINAVGAWEVDATKTPPSVLPLGRLPTSWWPGGVVTMGDGAVVVASMRGHGTGNDLVHHDLGFDLPMGTQMRGGVQRVPMPSTADLAAGEATVASVMNVAAQPGAPKVQCPSGVSVSDFPVPSSNTEGPSKQIQHVFFIVRENKDYDSLFGDFANANGDATLTMKTKTTDMDRIWTNLRTLARTFTFSDNYYTSAEYSTQGHVWTAYGRTNDFNERTWAISGGGTRTARLVPGGGIFDEGQPEEGSLFDWLDANRVSYNILGEINGSPQHPAATAIDFRYPGGPFQNISYDDTEKACHIAGRARVLCDFDSFVYATLPNDHTFGATQTNTAPETLCAVNDEATGMVVDAISHSPLWASSLIIITEDDPSQGGDHVDKHRAPLVVISPWVKRGTVAKTHIDVASVHKIFAHVFGKPYPNVEVANAGLPLEMFTSTPDYTPYTYTRRIFPLVCGDASTRAEQTLTASWDFDEPDEQPGLDAQVMRWMRGKQLQVLTPELRAQIERRVLARARVAPGD